MSSNEVCLYVPNQEMAVYRDPIKIQGCEKLLSNGLATDDLYKKQFLKIGVGARHHSVDVFEIGSSGILTWYIIALRDLPLEFLLATDDLCKKQFLKKKRHLYFLKQGSVLGITQWVF